MVLVRDRIKESLRKKFAKLANDFEQKLHEISVELTAIEGPLEVHPSRFYLPSHSLTPSPTAAGTTKTSPRHPDAHSAAV